jgi:putative heme-binding domain-containing protein
VGEDQTPEDLLNSMLNPDAEVAPRWWTIQVAGEDGEVREGFRMNEDSFSLRIMDADANLWSFQKRDIESYERSEKSTMPGYGQALSDGELDDLVAYLFSLRREVLPQ